jgi:hypothetical protein
LLVFMALDVFRQPNVPSHRLPPKPSPFEFSRTASGRQYGALES